MTINEEIINRAKELSDPLQRWIDDHRDNDEASTAVILALLADHAGRNLADFNDEDLSAAINTFVEWVTSAAHYYSCGSRA